MGIKRKYIDAVTETVLKMDPTLDHDQVEKIAVRIMKEKLMDPTIITDNNVTGETHKITLTSLCAYIDKEGPVVSGNATFYVQPTVLESPTSDMLRSLKVGRKAVKNEMFKYKPGSDEYEMLDLDQQNKKVIMNAEYGGSGTPTAAFYTKYSPAATTLMAQSIITTMAAFFEGYLGDNQRFYSVNELYDWMNTICRKETKIHKWVVRPTVDETLHRLCSHMDQLAVGDSTYIRMYLEHCTEDQLTYIYYANNLKEFVIRHIKVKDCIYSILMRLPRYESAIDKVPPEFSDRFPSVDAYNKWMSNEMFLNPYNIPECIKDIMDTFIKLVNQYVYVEYLTPDSIVKLNNHKRNTVLLVDTDSNIINADIFISFVLGEVFPGESFGRKQMYNEMILMNILCATLAVGVAQTLDYYGRCHNMDKKARSELAMKNEFMFRRLFLMLKKKRYCASIVLREGNIIIPFKPEMKGLDFVKAGVSDEVTHRFSKMLQDHILYSENLELHELMRDLKRFEKEIYENLLNGGTIYLKQQSYKSEDGYSKVKDKYGNVIGSKAWSLPVFKGAVVWNELNPTNKIYSLDRVKIAKLIVTGPQDLEIIKDAFPHEYEMAIDRVFRSTNVNIRNTGMKVICIPASVTEIPLWIRPLLDYDVIISDVISSFRSVLEALQIDNIYFKTPNGTASTTSCLISL